MPDAPIARQQVEHLAGDARFVHQANDAMPDQRRLFGGLGNHRIAGGQRGRHLRHEDRNRKIPRADTHKHTTPMQRQFIALAGRPRQGQWLAELASTLHRVVTHVVHGLAHFGHAVGNRFARLAHTQRHELRHPHFEQIGHLVEQSRPFCRRGGVPTRLRRHGGTDSFPHQCLVGIGHLAHDPGVIRRIDNATCSAGYARFAGNDGRRLPRLLQRFHHLRLQAGQHSLISEVDASRITAIRCVQIGGQHNFGMTLVGVRLGQRQRIGNDALNRGAFIANAVYE